MILLKNLYVQRFVDRTTTSPKHITTVTYLTCHKIDVGTYTYIMLGEIDNNANVR